MTGVRRVAISPPLACSEIRLLLQLGVADGELLVREAVPQMLAVGGPAAKLGALLEDWLAARPGERLRRRDAAIVALAAFCEPGSDNQLAKQIRPMVLRYESARWPRERVLNAAPIAHGAQGAALFALMRASLPWGAPGDRTIRNALAAADSWQNGPLSIANEQAEASTVPQSERNRKMNAAPKSLDFEVVAALARQPATQKLLADERTRVVAERKARVERIHVLDAKGAVAWPAGQAAIQAAVAKVRDAERALRQANDALAKANLDSVLSTHAHTVARQAEETALIASADMATIEAWKSEMIDEHTALCRPGIVATGTSTERSEVTKREVRHHLTSNSASIRARLKAVLEAYHAADLLALEPDQARLPQIIAEIRSSLPQIEETTITIEVKRG